ncbi:hypothetical protein HY500_03675 [Candidatus Woesearchaeota archaeon]|nr:hypothetical protein [Candidatus Woesearchaeota archaeon]
MLEKRGQVTVYIILGIVVIALFLITTYIRDSNILDSINKRVEINAQTLLAHARVEECITNIAKESVNILGAQGGKIELEESASLNPLVPFGNSLDIFNNDALRVPYWFYRTPNGINTQEIPSISDMELELGNYIKNNIIFCYEDLRDLGQYTVDYDGDSEVEVDIQDTKILVSIRGPLTVSIDDVSSNLDSFSIVLNAPLGRLYADANDILDKENKELFFEERTIDMIGLYDDIPGTDTGFSCDEKTWKKSEVERSFRSIVQTNVGNVRAEGDSKYYSLDVPTNAQVNFRYSTDWPFVMKVIPDEGEVMKGDSVIERKGLLKYLSRFLCLNSYHFVYDVQYPVLVTLSDNGYTFQYAFMVVIDNNQPRINSVDFDTIEEDTFDVCKVRNHLLDVSVFADGRNLDDADVSFQCFNSICSIGKTVNGNLNEKFPQCLNGKIIAEKEGYDKSELIIDTNQAGSASLELEPIYSKNLNVKLIDKKTGTTKDVANEVIIIEFTEENGYSTSLSYPEAKTVELRRGKYTVNVIVSKPGEVAVPSQEIERCTKIPGSGLFGDFLSKESCVKENFEATNLDQQVIGGNNFNFGITRENLVQSEGIIIYALVEDKELTQEGIISTYESVETNNLNSNFKLPEFT